MSAVHRFVVVAVVALATACSDGVTGENGVVRFSFAGQYATTPTLKTPVATNSTLRIVLQHPKAVLSVVDGDTFVQLHLTATSLSSSGSDPAVFPTGIAEFGVFFEKAGQYRLSAMQDTKEIDAVELTVAEPDVLAFSANASVTTSDGHCVSAEAVDLSKIDLAENQTASVFIEPRAKGVVLIGLPGLVADATNAKVTTLPSSFSLVQLGLIVERNGTAPIDVTVKDLGNGLSGTVQLKVHAGTKHITCD